MARKMTQEEFITKCIEIYKDKYDYSKVEYKGNKIKVCIICKEHGEFWMRPNDLLSNHTCRKCSHKSKEKINREDLINKFNIIHNFKYDYSTVEENYDELITIICPIHGEFKQKIDNHLHGNGCTQCGYEKSVNTVRIKIDEFKERFKKLDTDEFSFNDDEYKNITKPITFTHKICGRMFKRKPDVFISNPTCPHCNREEYSLLRCKDNEDFIAQANIVHNHEYDYSKTNYVKSDDKVGIICKEHGLFYIEANSHLQGHGCPYHYCNKSKQEEDLCNFIISLVGSDNVRINDRSLLKGKELDIFLPSYNIAIEYDGLFWHGELNKDKNYHINKTNECNENGIRLIHIFEDEWVYKKEIIKSMLKNLFNKNNNSIFARKCLVREVSPNESGIFLNSNHIQGKCPSSIKLGLYYNDELVSLMTFGKSRHFVGSGKHEYELLRFCNKINSRVIGGASKLFVYFLKNYNPTEIISYADKRWSEGNLYYKLNFIKYNESKPNYYYVIKNKRHYRFNFRKQILIEKYGCDKDMTEREFCFKQKWYRIYDCGCLCFIWNKKIVENG